ncbi:MAG: VOC family protein [Planctomycetia bacterium]|nr:VOC family protein [Planctomycetia bacterium]
MATRPAKPADMPWVTPMLTVRDADAALAFFQKAFGFEKKMSLPGPNGKTMHGEVVCRDGVIMFGLESDRNPCRAPITTGVRPAVAIYCYTDDVDALFKRATAAGAKAEMPPTDMFWGDRVCTVLDPDGYVWSFGTNVADFDPAKVPK